MSEMIRVEVLLHEKNKSKKNFFYTRLCFFRQITLSIRQVCMHLTRIYGYEHYEYQRPL